MKIKSVLSALLLVGSFQNQASAQAAGGRVQFKTAHAIYVEGPAIIVNDEVINAYQANLTGPIAQELYEMLIDLKVGAKEKGRINIYQSTCKVSVDGKCGKLVPLISCAPSDCHLRDGGVNREENADLAYKYQKTMAIGLNGYAVFSVLEANPKKYNYIKVAGPKDGGGSEGSGFAAAYIDLSHD